MQLGYPHATFPWPAPLNAPAALSAGANGCLFAGFGLLAQS